MWCGWVCIVTSIVCVVQLLLTLPRHKQNLTTTCWPFSLLLVAPFPLLYTVITGAALNQQQQMAGMNMAQMAASQMMQPMPAGMAAAGVHPGVAGQGMMWPMNAANMQQANLAQYMQLQQQQGANPAAAAGQQPAVSQPPG